MNSNLSFINFPGARECLANLTELCCSSNVDSEFFYKLSQICHNLQSLTIKFKSKVSNELKELISSQNNNLKNLKLFAYDDNNWKGIILHWKSYTFIVIILIYRSVVICFFILKLTRT